MCVNNISFVCVTASCRDVEQRLTSDSGCESQSNAEDLTVAEKNPPRNIVHVISSITERFAGSDNGEKIAIKGNTTQHRVSEHNKLN
jgi:hypothetical protein